ncbi:LapA family protein [Sphingomonas sp.]|uniref:LapA family protein n=1 Tax=Sphingomonas sp. TaxID=28214 RepID=UPI0025D1BE72|nr:LapA family protein [Sphingomonas sp.]
MQFLKTLFWFLLAVVVVVFALGNWTTVPIHLWAGLIAEINLPLLLIITFLAGLFPTLLYHHAVKWRLRHRLAAAERAVADLRGMATATTTPTTLVIDDGDAASIISHSALPSEA